MRLTANKKIRYQWLYRMIMRLDGLCIFKVRSSSTIQYKKNISGSVEEKTKEFGAFESTECILKRLCFQLMELP